MKLLHKHMRVFHPVCRKQRTSCPLVSQLRCTQGEHHADLLPGVMVAGQRWAGQLGPDECETEDEEARDGGGTSEEALLLAEEEEEMLFEDDEDEDDDEARRVAQRPVKEDLAGLPRHKVGNREVARGRGKGRG